MSLKFAAPAIVAGLTIGGGYGWLKTKSDDVPRDISFIFRLLRNKRKLQSIMKRKPWSYADFWDETSANNAHREAIVYIDDDGNIISYTYEQVNKISNQIANWAVDEGIQSGDVVALLMSNRPEFIFCWLAMAKLHVPVALINTHLRGKPLIHSFSISGATTFIVGKELVDGVNEIRKHDDLPSSLKDGKWFCYGNASPSFLHLDPLIQEQRDLLQVPFNPKREPMDVMLYIYTSGTTGLPKASIITHFRFYLAGLGFAESLNVVKSDKIYTAGLPLYHSSGGNIGVGAAFYRGATVILRSRFSASKFWYDCIHTNATVIQYIGELCRYLLAHPTIPEEKQHKIRLAIGNGLRSDIWNEFQNRFSIEQIGEFYAATEGNANMINTENEFAAVGFIPQLLQKFFPVVIVKHDVETGEVVRGPNGRCIPCADGEIGELVGLIDNNDPLRAFKGYTDKKATEKKILKDVFQPGDMYFRTGDLLRRDKRGFFFFIDRIGDTFRWKGENVSTSEVEYVLNQVKGVQESSVYGVKIPQHDGRAGMASLVVDKHQFDIKNFYEKVKSELPSYAAPLFLRIRNEIEITTTFKHKKTVLVNEGYNVLVIQEPVFIRDDEQKTYIPFTKDMYHQMHSGNLSAKL